MLIVATKYLFAKNVHLIIWRLNYSKVFKIFFLPTIKYSFANNIDVLLLARPFKYLSAGRAPSRPPLGRAPSWFAQGIVEESTQYFSKCFLKYSKIFAPTPLSPTSGKSAKLVWAAGEPLNQYFPEIFEIFLFNHYFKNNNFEN